MKVGSTVTRNKGYIEAIVLQLLQKLFRLVHFLDIEDEEGFLANRDVHLFTNAILVHTLKHCLSGGPMGLRVGDVELLRRLDLGIAAISLPLVDQLGWNEVTRCW